MTKIMFCETNILNGKKEEQNKNLKEKRERDVKQFKMPDVSGTLTKWKGRQLESTPITPYENRQTCSVTKSGTVTEFGSKDIREQFHANIE
ncbi:unnamed protein product [Brugia timori]|uniref:Uncharacterized protein n=1 Tax=Brugia timori TaxID=42155 RepID=A0A0R3R7M1_9BILA|nr:unnamed protein product [Brugia timori]